MYIRTFLEVYKDIFRIFNSFYFELFNPFIIKIYSKIQNFYNIRTFLEDIRTFLEKTSLYTYIERNEYLRPNNKKC